MYNAVVVAGEGKKQISLLLGPPQGKFVSFGYTYWFGDDIYIIYTRRKSMVLFSE
jgi:hypothetical protein